jgi:CubicO group peptidase (beta-lactamase class C family)
MKTTVFLLLMAVKVTILFSQSPNNIEEVVDNLLLDYNKGGKFNGTVLVAKSGEIKYYKSFGYSDLENRTELSESSVYCLASVSKIFTGTAIMLLEQDGILSIDDAVTKYLKSLPEFYSRVSIRHLLSHTSGIRERNQDWKSQIGMSNTDVYNFVKNQESLQFQPGSKYSYSNTGFNLLAILIDTLSGTSFREYVESRIFQHCNMKTSFVRPDKNSVVPHKVVKSYVNGQQADWPLYTYGPGGVYCSALDLYKWDKAFFSGDVLGQDKMSMVLDRVENSGGGVNNYGLGWGVFASGGMTSVGHTGGMFGFRTLYERILEKDITIIILTNIGDATPLMEIRTRILQLFIK